MDGRRILSGFLLALLLAPTGLAQEIGTGPARERQRLGWDWQAESTFRLGRGLAPQLMTEAEWQAHQARMRAMSPEEREEYRAQIHAEMMQRAEEQGVTPPQQPRGRGAQPWWRFGPGGRGRGSR